MKKRIWTIWTIICSVFVCALSLVPSTTSAALTSYSNRATFEASGIIAENYGYGDFGSGFSYPGDPWTSHGVTYTSANNLIVGTGTGYSPVSNVYVNNYWSPETGSIAFTPPGYDMFGVDLAAIGSSSADTLNVSTSLGTYTFSGIFLPNVSATQKFFGWTAGPSEYFTGFDFFSAGGGGYGITLDNVTLGNEGLNTNKGNTVPEPGTLLLLGSGLASLGLLGLWRRRKTTPMTT